MTYAHAHGPATRTDEGLVRAPTSGHFDESHVRTQAPRQEVEQSACVPVERQPEPSSSQGGEGFLLREHITRRERRLFIAEFVSTFARVSK